MNILYDHQIFSRQRYGGISRYFFELVYYINHFTNHNLQLLAPFYLNEYLPGLSKDILSGIKVQKIPIFLGPFLLLRINNILSRISQLSRQEYDIFHETYYSTVDFKSSSAKRVITVYDMAHEVFRNTYFKGDKLSEIKIKAIKRADYVICISESTQKNLINFFDIAEEKTSVIHLGHSLQKFSEGNITLPFNKPFLLFVGLRSKYKNFTKLLTSFAESKKLKDDFLLICFGGGAFSSDEKNMIKRLGLPNSSVTQISGDDRFLSALYRKAKAFIYPSFHEGFGIPLLEAMSLGCPIACSNTSCFPEIVGDAAEFFDPYDEADIRSAIERIVFNISVSQSLTIKGYERVKRFSWTKCARETLEVYEKLLI